MLKTDYPANMEQAPDGSCALAAIAERAGLPLAGMERLAFVLLGHPDSGVDHPSAARVIGSTEEAERVLLAESSFICMAVQALICRYDDAMRWPVKSQARENADTVFKHINAMTRYWADSKEEA